MNNSDHNNSIDSHCHHENRNHVVISPHIIVWSTKCTIEHTWLYGKACVSDNAFDNILGQVVSISEQLANHRISIISIPPELYESESMGILCIGLAKMVKCAFDCRVKLLALSKNNLTPAAIEKILHSCAQVMLEAHSTMVKELAPLGTFGAEEDAKYFYIGSCDADGILCNA